MTTPNDKADLREQINIEIQHLQKIQALEAGEPDGEKLVRKHAPYVTDRTNAVDAIMELFAVHDQKLKAAVLAKRLKVSVPNDDLMDMVEIEVVPTKAINKVFEEGV